VLIRFLECRIEIRNPSFRHYHLKHLGALLIVEFNRRSSRWNVVPYARLNCVVRGVRVGEQHLSLVTRLDIHDINITFKVALKLDLDLIACFEFIARINWNESTISHLEHENAHCVRLFVDEESAGTARLILFLILLPVSADGSGCESC